VHQQKAYDEQQRMIADNRTLLTVLKAFSKPMPCNPVKMLEKLVVQVDEVDTSALKLKFHQQHVLDNIQ
jgi:ATP-binding cassette subfamily F protein 3